MSSNKVAVIIPVKNGASFLDECLQSILEQDFTNFQVCIFDDGSNDTTPEIIDKFSIRFIQRGIDFRHKREHTSRGVGYAKNQAVELSDARFICFCDADDLALRDRVRIQYEECLRMPEPENCLLGSFFCRVPDGSTSRFTSWACKLNESQLYTQIYTAFGPTLVAPTWFLSRNLYNKLGGFDTTHIKGFPEDLDFFYRMLRTGAKLKKIEKSLVIYRYHTDSATFGVDENTIWDIRIKELQQNVLCKWNNFIIWNAGKQGKRFYRSIGPDYRNKVCAFCDVDERKLRFGAYEVYDEIERRVTESVPIIHYSKATPPVIICVKLDMTHGDFERYLSETGWKEGIDYFLFS